LLAFLDRGRSKYSIKESLPMSLSAYIEKVRTTPEALEFSELMDLIAATYKFTPTEFKNGAAVNLPEQNQGSCKLLAFAKLHGLDKAQTLACFGGYYREDVLQNPDGKDHQNIRNFMTHGWDGIAFKGEVLTLLKG